MNNRLLSAAALLLGASQVSAGFSSTSNSNVAVYWGQNSYGQATGSLAQQRLSYYCANSNIDIFPLAFLTNIHDQYGEPEINFANAGNNCSVFAGTQLLDCSQLAADIPSCQAMGKTILLSIGGATYTEGGFASSDAAVAGANVIWETFGPVDTSSNALRPFGSASVDGFDFDFESTVSNTVPFANQLRSLMDNASDGRKRFLTAAPQCPYPDAADSPFLQGAVSMDAVFVQYYNNYCGLQSFVEGATTQNNFNFETWDTWAKTVSKNPNVKVFLGIPANVGGAGSGYEPVSVLAPIIEYVQGFSSFGGVMMWDSTQAYSNGGFLAAVKALLTVDEPVTTTTTVAMTTMTTTKTTAKPTTTTTTKTTATPTTTTTTKTTAKPTTTTTTKTTAAPTTKPMTTMTMTTTTTTTSSTTEASAPPCPPETTTTPPPPPSCTCTCGGNGAPGTTTDPAVGTATEIVTVTTTELETITTETPTQMTTETPIVITVTRTETTTEMPTHITVTVTPTSTKTPVQTTTATSTKMTTATPTQTTTKTSTKMTTAVPTTTTKTSTKMTTAVPTTTTKMTTATTTHTTGTTTAKTTQKTTVTTTAKTTAAPTKTTAKTTATTMTTSTRTGTCAEKKKLKKRD